MEENRAEKKKKIIRKEREEKEEEREQENWLCTLKKKFGAKNLFWP
jgi:hypothetical protein